jgi:hypothetical protein
MPPKSEQRLFPIFQFAIGNSQFEIHAVRPKLIILVIASLLAGCRPTSAPIAVAPPPAGQSITCDDLAAVLSEVLDREGRIDPTALAVHLPRLERQLSLLALPWPQEAAGGHSDQRLAWLYNARAAWSLRIIARELFPLEGRRDAFDLPAAIDRERLMNTPFPLDGRQMSLTAIDVELAGWGDFRLAALAPDATDLAGPLPQRPFAADTVRQDLPARLATKLLADPRRLVIDHDQQVVGVPPAIWRARQNLIMEYNQHQPVRPADLLTALRPLADPAARQRLTDAMGYRVEERRGPAGISALRLDRQERLRRFGPPGN